VGVICIFNLTGAIEFISGLSIHYNGDFKAKLYIWHLNLFMSVNMTTERIDSYKLFNKMRKKFLGKKKMCF